MPFTGTQYTALITSLRVGDWDGVAKLIDGMVLAEIAALRRELVQAITAVRQITRPDRSLDAEFVISLNHAAEVRYGIMVPVKLLGIGTDSAEVALLINGIQVRSVGHVLGIGVGLSINQSHTKPEMLAGFVPAGATVQLVTLSASNSAAAPSLVTAEEELLP